LKIIPFREYTEDASALALYMTCLADLYQEIAITKLLQRKSSDSSPFYQSRKVGSSMIKENR
jgi:hypothetical protein